jgi:hypothetical protein
MENYLSTQEGNTVAGDTINQVDGIQHLNDAFMNSQT